MSTSGAVRTRHSPSIRETPDHQALSGGLLGWLDVSPGLERLLDVAVRAARAGGEVIRKAEGTGSTGSKGAGDYVTEVDLASEATIGRVLREATPEIPLL